MPTKTLNAAVNPPDGVVSPSNIAVYVGNPPRELRIYSGVAQPEWDSQLDLDWEDIVVVLGPPTTEFFQSTSTASLASITNTDSDFVFAANSTSVVNRPGGLELHVRIGVKGESSLFSRFSYHVQVLSDPIVALISGNIRWDQTLGDPTEAAKNGSAMFRVSAGNIVIDSTGGGFATSHWQEIAFTFTSASPLLGNGYWVVPYVLTGVPLGQQVIVQPSLLPGVLVSPPFPAQFNPSPQQVTLTLSSPTAIGVNFEMLLLQGPH